MVLSYVGLPYLAPNQFNYIIMKAKFGAIVTEGRGKLGGHVFSKNRSGAYMRTKVTPVNPQTVAQATVRNRLSGPSQGWKGLTQALRNAWNAAVANFTGTNIFGDSVTPTGKNLYTKLNINLANAARAAITAPPLPLAVVEPTLVITSFTDAPALTITVGNLNADQTYLIHATEPVSPGVGFFKNKYRVIGRMEGAATQPFDAGSMYVAKFGAPVADLKAGFKVVPVVNATGQNGIGAFADAIAV